MNPCVFKLHIRTCESIKASTAILFVNCKLGYCYLRSRSPSWLRVLWVFLWAFDDAFAPAHITNLYRKYLLVTHWNPINVNKYKKQTPGKKEIKQTGECVVSLFKICSWCQRREGDSTCVPSMQLKWLLCGVHFWSEVFPAIPILYHGPCLLMFKPSKAR